jgi:hypothetical protein
MRNNNQLPLKLNHQKLYDHLRSKNFFYTQYGRRSSKEFRPYRVLFSILYLVFGVGCIITFVFNVKAWYVGLGVATVIDAGIVAWFAVKNIKVLQNGSHSLYFLYIFELETFLKIDLGLDRNGIMDLSELCLNLSERCKRNYYRLDIAVAVLAIFVTIISILKEITLNDIGSLTVIFGLFIAGMWMLFGNLATALDQRSDRYFGIYLITRDIFRNKHYRQLRKEHKKRLRDETDIENQTSVEILA